MCVTGDPLPPDRNRRPYVPILRDLRGKHGKNLTIVSEQWYATLWHYERETGDILRHATGAEPCFWCKDSGVRPRWTGWVFAIGHDCKRSWLLPITDTAVKYCPAFKAAQENATLKGTHWIFSRKSEKRNGPMCIRVGPEPILTLGWRKFPDLAELVLATYDGHCGPERWL